ncbi:PD-(D/E)XK nuclease family protein [Flavobacteriaceae bacterium 14752]|uniref:PD-(D/E)XK nuclease family protein n=1 Tax=Mesohalobacter salilacus TaxID=2491711 RepID=UPI000F62EA12|nr:PD-(D/E)XK nuclease family protein [Flavobacteriaceae bacterium 14752]
MQTLLGDFVEHYTNNFGLKSKESIIILPSKRSVAELKHKFAEHQNAFWLPRIIDIVTFIKNISKLEILSQEDTLIEFYKVYTSNFKNHNTESFENIYPWASVLINDFNEIDRFLLNTSQFFEHHKSLKKLNYFGEEETDMIKSYIKFWENLPHYYNKFKAHCLNSNFAYQGLAYRIASENIDSYLKKQESSIFFVGFNALNKAEECIFETCLKNNLGYIAWDIDDNILLDQSHPANTFIKKYHHQWSAYKDRFIKFNNKNYSSEKSISIISSQKNIGQAKAVSRILKNINSDNNTKTAIVLNDENLLSPILNSIPDDLHEVNITMGLSLNKSPISDFFTLILDQQLKKEETLSHDLVSTLLHHKLLNYQSSKNIDAVKSYLLNNGLLKYSIKEINQLFQSDNLAKKVFSCLKHFNKPSDFLRTVVDFISSLLDDQITPFKQYLLAYQKIFLNLRTVSELNPELSLMALKLLFKDYEKSEKLSFKGEKHKGLQIMGMLESRLLDFDNVIFVSVNEGVIPAGKTDNSYITYDLKKQYGLPTYTEKDAIYAYHFFRLIQRSKNCYMIYDSDQSGFNKGERSRFLSYLEVFKSPNHKLISNAFSLSTSLKPKEAITFKKSAEVLAKLKKLVEQGLSPTALSAYIRNPIQFYKRYVLGIKETENFEEILNYKHFGTIIHESIEELYPSQNQYLNEADLELLCKKTPNVLQSKFEKIYSQDVHKFGSNRIQYEIAKGSLLRFLNKEKETLKKSDLFIQDIEKPVESIIKINNQNIKLKGHIDRIDKYNNELRIIDLKTGNVQPKHLKFNDYTQLISDDEYAKAFQILFYALVYSKNYDTDNLNAGIISFKNLNQWFMPLNFDGKTTINQSILIEFEHYLHQLISEILDPNIPFKEKDVNFES